MLTLALTLTTDLFFTARSTTFCTSACCSVISTVVGSFFIGDTQWGADHGDVETFEAIDARLREAFRWLEKAITYLNGLKPPIEHRFDLGYGYVFDSPRFAHGSVGQHERRIRGFPVLEQIDVYYEISASKPLSIEVVPGWVSFAEKTLDAFGLQYTCRRMQDSVGTLGRSSWSVSLV